jgi:hypothetical protein
MTEENYCEICGKEILEDSRSYTYPDLARYVDPGIKHTQTWCDWCSRDFQKMFRGWRHLRKARALAHPSID